nr:hypothetical protein [Kofleriaceae bacterium]
PGVGGGASGPMAAGGSTPGAASVGGADLGGAPGVGGGASGPMSPAGATGGAAMPGASADLAGGAAGGAPARSADVSGLASGGAPAASEVGGGAAGVAGSVGGSAGVSPAGVSTSHDLGGAVDADLGKAPRDLDGQHSTASLSAAEQAQAKADGLAGQDPAARARASGERAAMEESHAGEVSGQVSATTGRPAEAAAAAQDKARVVREAQSDVDSVASGRAVASLDEQAEARAGAHIKAAGAAGAAPGFVAEPVAKAEETQEAVDAGRAQAERAHQVASDPVSAARGEAEARARAGLAEAGSADVSTSHSVDVSASNDGVKGKVD